MPRVKQLWQPSYGEKYIAEINKAMTLNRIPDYKSLAAKARINYSTLLLRLKDPSTFRFGEMMAIKKILGVFPEGG